MFTYIRWLILVASCLLGPIFLANASAQNADYRFTSGGSALGVPFELSGNLIVMKVQATPLHFRHRRRDFRD
jgi:hypothetical protein